MKEDKLSKIINWYSTISKEETKQLVEQNNFELIHDIEELLGEPIPQEIIHIYKQYDGEKGEGVGAFMGHSIISLAEMIHCLEFSKTQLKPSQPKIPNPEKADELIQKMIGAVVQELPIKKAFGFLKAKWFKAIFEASPNSIGGPYLYRSEITSGEGREIVQLSDKAYDAIVDTASELYELEYNDYNWDNLEITAYSNGKYEVNRAYSNLENDLSITSTPARAIKKKYFHIKWIPLISDYGGNYIGIDLDPDENGTKGQVIIFGRDDIEMLVLANSWGEFLDWNLDLINQGGAVLKNASHLHDTYKEIIYE